MYLIFRIIITLLFFSIFISCNREAITEPPDLNTPPSIPVGLIVFGASDGEVGIEWNSNFESNMKGYNIYRSINNPDNFNYINFTTMNYYIDDSLDYNTTYYYRITAINKAEKESDYTSYVSATPINLYPPLTPYYLIASARNNNESYSITLSWNKSLDTDLKGYEIYRSESQNFTADSSTFYKFLEISKFSSSFVDNDNLKILTPYYYKLRAVDKGDLKSPFSAEVTDMILDSPVLTYPENESYFYNSIYFKFITSSHPAKYKFVIQSNEIYGTVYAMDLVLNNIHEEVTIYPENLYLQLNKKYYWRVLTYTNNSDEPNSFSRLFSFTISQ